MPTKETSVNFDVLDHHVTPGMEYVTLIVDVWRGDRKDPATAVDRYLGLWSGESLENGDGEAVDPSFSQHGWKGVVPNPEPLVWECFEHIKTADRTAESHKEQTDRLQKRNDGYGSTHHNRQVDLYEAFLEAIERVAVDDTDEEAWTAITAWRNRLDEQYER